MDASDASATFDDTGLDSATPETPDGADDRVIVNPRPCSPDAGPLAASGWASVTPPGVSLDAGSGFGTLNVMVDPEDPATVYVSTDRQGIYRSRDCGSTWAKVDTGRNSNVIDSGMGWNLFVDPTDSNIMYTNAFNGSDPTLFKSTDSGLGWDSLMPPGSNVRNAVPFDGGAFFQELSIDPTNHLHLVVSFHRNCLAPYAALCLGESQDGGNTWQIFNGPPLNGWQEDGGPLVVDADRILYGGQEFNLYLYSHATGAWTDVSPAGSFSYYPSPDGWYYMGTSGLVGNNVDGGMQRSRDMVHWDVISGTPVFVERCMVGDGVHMYAGSRRDNVYVTASVTDGTTWTSMPAPPGSTGPSVCAYDTVHHVLFSANQGGGLWRMVTSP
jgi:hypothetical protein